MLKFDHIYISCDNIIYCSANQSTGDWFLNDRNLRHERVKNKQRYGLYAKIFYLVAREDLPTIYCPCNLEEEFSIKDFFSKTDQIHIYRTNP